MLSDAFLWTQTLAKVICTVVKFSDDQTRLILEKEETKSSVSSVYLDMQLKIVITETWFIVNLCNGGADRNI